MAHAGALRPHIGGAAVVSSEAEIVGEGAGFIGQVARVALDYDGPAPGAPRTLIAKIPSTDPGSRQVGNLYGLYEREVRFYNDLAPRAGIPAPACYFADYDAAAGQSLILLEDLQTGAFGDQVGGCLPEEARLAVEAVARLHATWWQSPQLDGLTWMATGDALVRNAMLAAYDACWEPCVARFGHTLSPAMIEAGPGLGRQVLALLDVFASRPLTIVHGDYRLDNMFFGHQDSARPLVVCDWQSPNRGWGAYDLAYFIAGGLETGVRRRQEMDLIAGYHHALVEAGVRRYSLEQLTEDYRLCMAVMMGIFVINGATLPTTNERGVAVFERMLGRFDSAISDLGTLSALAV